MAWNLVSPNTWSNSNSPYIIRYDNNLGQYIVENVNGENFIPLSDIFNNPAFPIDLSNADVLVKSLTSSTTVSAGTVVSGTHLRSENVNTPATPGHSFKTEINSGLYRESAGVLAISVLGNKQLSIDSNGYFLKSNNVAGHFERTTSYSAGAVVAFDTAILNNTNYNTSTGRFTAPVTGTYLFYVQGIALITSRVGVFFRKNGVNYTYNISTTIDATGANSGCQIAIIQLNASEYIDVYAGYAGTFSYSKGCFFGFYLIG